MYEMVYVMFGNILNLRCLMLLHCELLVDYQKSTCIYFESFMICVGTSPFVKSLTLFRNRLNFVENKFNVVHCIKAGFIL